MKEFFVIGNQTSSSLSPLIFNHWFKKYKIKAKYSYLEVDDIGFDTAVAKKLENKNTTGFNVTIPYKKRIFKHLKTKNVHATQIGAVNCVLVGANTKGINTDWIGYMGSIKNTKIKKAERY